MSCFAPCCEQWLKRPEVAFWGGVTLFFISLILPLQFDKEWLTIGWALEGVALLCFFKHMPHPGLKKWALGLLIVAFVRLALNPSVLDYHSGGGIPLIKLVSLRLRCRNRLSRGRGPLMALGS